MERQEITGGFCVNIFLEIAKIIHGKTVQKMYVESVSISDCNSTDTVYLSEIGEYHSSFLRDHLTTKSISNI